MAGIGMLPMACVGLGLMPRLDIRHGFAFMGVNMRPIQRELGFSIKTSWGDDGVFPHCGERVSGRDINTGTDTAAMQVGLAV